MGSLASAKPHAVIVPFPAQGHVNPLMQLAQLLNARGFHITFVNTEHNHRRLIRSKGPDSVKGTEDFRFETIPDGLPPSDKDATQNIPALCDSTSKHCLIPFTELLQRLNSLADVPPVTCVVSDGVMSFAMEAAEKLGIPEVQFWTTSACGFMAYLQFDELVRRGIVPFKDESFLHDGTLDMPIDWIPGMPNMKLRDIPTFMRITDMNDIMFNFLGGEAKKTLKASAVLINTFEELESEILDQLKLLCPNLYPGGPLNMLLNKHVPKGEIGSFRSSLWVEDTECLEWLDERDPESVVYVNYGCVTVMSDQHLKEFAWGLANSKHPFLWIVRPDVVMGESAILPPEFLEEVKDRGLIKSWCPQDVVLRHPSVGAFLSHCGWNSVSESIAGGVPLICWPFFSEQQTNCRYACVEWGMGMEVNNDVKRGEIEELVKEMMEGEKGREMRKNAKEWKRKAEKATDVGGSAYKYFDRFIKEALHFTEEIEWKSTY